jgi:hypothetical protein
VVRVIDIECDLPTPGANAFRNAARGMGIE